ncbi:Conserved_hypothetical protein [Hexamita inflata]|uniref:Uncharacterized protein n=1 Tax=Hexamita inflata TaxID=28002 RepID=A0AA86RLN2_9EUKA|nr:Conserved hypothetical protein [Hexamita inflata]
MKHNRPIRSKEELLNLFGSSQKLEILNQQQMEDLLKMNAPPEVWEDASNRHLLSFNQELIKYSRDFTFNNRKIEYIHLLSFLTNLTELDLQYNNISDISSISLFKNLKKLYLRDNCIEDISALQSLPDLTHLSIQFNKLTSYTLALPNLVYLLLSGNMLHENSGLLHSPKLQDLYLSGTETTDLHTIPHQLFGLIDLELSCNNLTEISYLSNFVDLQFLELGDNKQLQNIGPLKFCTQLTQLRINETNVADIWSLQFLKHLKRLNMSKTKVIDLHPLQFLYKLEDICASQTCIIDVSPLSNLTQLIDLFLNCNKLTNADTLKHHKNFSDYNLSNQEVPTPDELKFYNKILNIHNSHKQIKKIVNDNKITKFRTSLAQKKNCVSTMLNNQTQTMNKQIDMLIQIVQNSISYLD